MSRRGRGIAVLNLLLSVPLALGSRSLIPDILSPQLTGRPISSILQKNKSLATACVPAWAITETDRRPVPAGPRGEA